MTERASCFGEHWPNGPLRVPGAKGHARRAAGLFHETAPEIGSDEMRCMGLDLATLWCRAEDIAGRPHLDDAQDSEAGTAVFEFSLRPA